MARPRKGHIRQKKAETRGEYFKRLRKINKEKLAGTVITEWTKGGRTITVDKTGLFSRSGLRRSRHDAKPRRARPEGSTFTRPSYGSRRARRRATNWAAKRARRTNR